jgi:hypothetical protein
MKEHRREAWATITVLPRGGHRRGACATAKPESGCVRIQPPFICPPKFWYIKVSGKITRLVVGAGFSLRPHRLESLCHRGFLRDLVASQYQREFCQRVISFQLAALDSVGAV